MSIAILSAISLVCIDVSLAQRPLAEAAPPVRAAGPIALTAQAPPLVMADETADMTVPPEAAPLDRLEPPSTETVSQEEEFDESLVFEGESDEALVEKLMAYLEDLETLTGDFRQVAPSGAVSTGRFYLRRPGFLRFEYDEPAPLLIVANGGMVYVRDEALETTDSYPVGKTPLKFLLSKKIDLRDARVIGVDRGVDSVAVTFASETEETEGELTIITTAPEISLARWVVRDLQNGITEVALSNVKTGEKLANRLFRTPEAGGDFLKN